ncbi:hypothetical protein LZ578_01780 [Jeotgalibaca sp. MA1X17-3]|uniref:hypothetical protein n=1 Tax=Jeotgalibaca sp. MA1X17-3 TaxID=2908211 RepID=UPI001F2A87EE|nr:hypothetical protein [Jeotgalibaca sp. MA1X17-3]UJF15901.1 hypothetical protein LZ578_01780 [Jeotgalibaca sp. MA1X17-3]
MSNHILSNWMKRISWLAGLIIFISGKNYIEENILWKIPDEQMILQLWALFLIPFLTGVYLSLLFLGEKTNKNDYSLLLVILLPTLLFAILPILIRTFAVGPIPYELTWLIMKVNTGNLLPLVAGLTFLPAFTVKRKRRR